MATPQEIELAAQEAAKQLVGNGSFNPSSSKLKAACGVENPLCNGMTKEEKAKVQAIVKDRLDQAKELTKTLPALMEDRDRAIDRLKAVTAMVKDCRDNVKFAQEELATAVPGSAREAELQRRIRDNQQRIDQDLPLVTENATRVTQIEDQMKRVTQAAVGTAVKNDPTDQSVPVKKAMAEKAAQEAAPKESKSLLQTIRSKLS